MMHTHGVLCLPQRGIITKGLFFIGEEDSKERRVIGSAVTTWQELSRKVAGTLILKEKKMPTDCEWIVFFSFTLRIN